MYKTYVIVLVDLIETFHFFGMHNLVTNLVLVLKKTTVIFLEKTI